MPATSATPALEHSEPKRGRLSELCRRISPVAVLQALVFGAFFLLCVLRMNISIAIVAMVNWTAVRALTNQSGVMDCEYNETVEPPKDSEFVWDANTQGFLLSSYFYGLTATQLLGGRLAEKFSAKHVILLGTLLSTAASALSPLGAWTNWYILLFLQVAKGAGQGILVPALSVMVGNWVPVTQRISFMSIGTSGLPLGAFVSTLIYGYLCKSDFLGGWPSAFYVSGIAGLVWCLLWQLLVHDSPLLHPWITPVEIRRLMSVRTQEAARMKPHDIPVKAIMTSLPVWAYFFVGFSSLWTISLFSVVLPTFLGTILRYPIAQNGVMSSFPNLLQAFVLLASSYICEDLHKKHLSKTTLIRKVTISLGLGGFAVFMIAAGFAGCNRPVSVFLLTMALGISGCSFAAIMVVPVDLAPRYAGTLSGIMSTFASLSGIMIPTIMAALTEKEQTLREWKIIFFISGAICFFSIIFFCIFGSSERQEWNYPSHLQREHSNEETDHASHS